MKHFHIINLFYSSFLPYLLTKICFLKARLKPRNSSDTIFGTELSALLIEMLCVYLCDLLQQEICGTQDQPCSVLKGLQVGERCSAQQYKSQFWIKSDLHLHKPPSMNLHCTSASHHILPEVQPSKDRHIYLSCISNSEKRFCSHKNLDINNKEF